MVNENDKGKEMDLNKYWDETKLDMDFVKSLTIMDRQATIVSIEEVMIKEQDTGNEKLVPEATLDFYKKKVIKKFLLNRTSKDNLRDGFGTSMASGLIGKRCYPSVKSFGNNKGIVLNPIITVVEEGDQEVLE